MTVLIKGGTVVSSTASVPADVLIEGEKIAQVGSEMSADGAEVIDATGKLVLPGGVDVHTHLDMPLGDISSSDDFFSGHVAAAFGGTTTHIDFANQAKGETLRSAIDEWHSKARDRAAIDYGFHVTITDVNDRTLHEIADLPSLGISTVKMLMAYKGRIMVDDASLYLAMEQARDAGLLTMVHCENGDVIDILVQRAVAEGHTEPRRHALTRPRQLEGEATGRAIAMAEILGAPLYVVHVTCEPALRRIREARARGSNIRAETCVQYLFFTEDDLDRPDFEGAKWVCSPPFRTRADGEAIWTALASGDLDVVSTDHCPFWFESDKILGLEDFSLIPSGCPGIEDRLQMLHEAGVREGRFDLQRFVSLTATEPARIFGLEGRKGVVARGYDADIAIWDLDRTRTVSVASSHSRVDYNLYEGMTVRGIPQKVFCRGRLIVDGEQFLGERGYGRFLHRERVIASPPMEKSKTSVP